MNIENHSRQDYGGQYMRRLLQLSMTAWFLFAGCNDAKTPSNANFTEAINQFLASHGRACSLIAVQLPTDIPRSEQSGIAEKLTALQHAGVLSETDTSAVVHGLMDALRGPTPPQPVRHYVATAEGQKYIQPVTDTVIPATNFCYGQKSVDSVTHWKMGSQSAAQATYTYRIVNAAAWAQGPEMQQAFPDIRATLRGVSKTEQTIGLQLTNTGWLVQ